MIISKIKSHDDNHFELIIDNKKYIIYGDVLLKMGILKPKEITPDELSTILSLNNYYDAYYKIITFINYRPRFSKEVLDKLNKLGINSKVSNDLIIDLTQKGLIDDQKCLKLYINNEVKTSMKGPYKILSELKLLGLKESDILNELNLIDDSLWQDKAVQLINKKIKANRVDSAICLKNKIIKYLSMQGYNEKYYDASDIKISDDQKIYQTIYDKTYKRLSKKYSGQTLEYKVNAYMQSKGFYK